MKTKQLVEQIQQEFKERFGVNVHIDLQVHGTNSPHVNQELAQHICTQFGEFKDCEHKGTKWVKYDNYRNGLELSVFYDKEIE